MGIQKFFANPKVLFANQKVLLVNPKALLANPNWLYWLVSIGVTAWQHPQLVTREGVLKSMTRQSRTRELRGQKINAQVCLPS
jgi:hypothetical protein